METKEGKLIILSAPSGSGKSTIINEVMRDESLNLRFSISATNRAPREGETNGVNYHFISTEEFRSAIENDELVEYEEVYPGRFYGTLKKEISRITDSGNNVILDIDVKGALNVKRIYGNRALSIFIMPPSIDSLRERLERRATESPEAIEQRISKAEFELSFAPHFDCVVVNDVLEDAVKLTHAIISRFVKS